MQHQRILFFSAYAAWNYHAQIEMTLAAALRLRGASVRAITCDGLFPVCDVFRANLNPRGSNSCNECQASVAATMSALGAEYRWLSRFVPQGLIEEARAWSEALAPEALAEARWKQRPVAEWALSSAMYQGRRSIPDWSDPEFVALFRKQLHGTVLALEGMLAVFDDYKPDLLVTQNGRFFAHRAAIEVARERGVRFATHERGVLRNTLAWRECELRHELAGEQQLWQECKHVPLTPQQIDFVSGVLHERRFGKGMSWDVRYSPPPEERRGLLARLSLDERPIIALFTSSEDEQATFKHWSAGAFQDGRKWLEATVEIARGMPSHQFVIRMHPALVSYGANNSAVDHARELSQRLPENCRLVMPKDQVSSYTLADAADVGVVYYTTMGLEMAARGKRVLCVAAGSYGRAGFADFVEREADYEGALRRAIGRGPDQEIARIALRYAWQSFGVWSMSFGSVIEEPMHAGKRTYRSLDELRPGRDAVLDATCAYLLHGQALSPRPPREVDGRALELETQRIAEVFAGIVVDTEGEAQEMIVRAEGLFEAGQATQACDLLLRAIEIDPLATRAWKDLGAILHATGNVADAAEALEHALRIDPNDREAANDLELVRASR